MLSISTQSMTHKKLITIVTPCYNEAKNIQEVYTQVKKLMSEFPQYQYEQLFIDNASQDATVPLLRAIAEKDKNVKVIINSRNFGHIRSPFHGLLQAKGDGVILMVADLQDPPELIRDFLIHWEQGFKVVIGIKPSSQEKFPLATIRRLYYHFAAKISDVNLHKNFCGYGLYDQSVIAELRNIDDPYPYFRGLIAELGFKTASVFYHQKERLHGKSKNNFYTLYDMAMLGITAHSKLPIRIATMIGFLFSFLSFLAACIFCMLKIFFWSYFPIGIAPILISVLFLSSVQIIFIGLLGEYILSIHTQILRRPRVIEQERINFNEHIGES